jgi:hypothetical protein
MDDEDEEMPGMPQHDAPIQVDGASETDDDAMNESGTESSHCYGINGVGRAT